jgi:hypothetical protein
MIEFIKNPSARILGSLLGLACLSAAILAKFMKWDIDLTQIILMILGPAMSMISYGMGAAHMTNAIQKKEGEQ